MHIPANKLYKALVITFVNFALISCSTTSIDLTKVKEEKVTKQLHIMQPELDQRQTVNRGGVISHYETGFYLSTQSKQVELLSSLNNINNEYPQLKPGSIAQLSTDINGYNGACFDQSNNNEKQINQAELCLIDTDKDGYFEQAVLNNTLIENLSIQYRINTEETKTNYSNQLRKQLVYRGITVDKIKFTYLEFKNDMQNPLVERDFTISNHKDRHITLNYKGSHFTIIEADNVNIVFEMSSYLQ